MAPDSGQRIVPDHDAGASDFEVAGQLFHAILHHDGAPPETTLTRLCCSALASPRGCFVPDDSPCADPEWADLVARARATGTLALSRTAPDSSRPERLALPLIFRDRLLGCIAVGGAPDGYDVGAMRRLADLGSLLSGALYARLTHDERMRALSESEARIRRQSQMLDRIDDALITMDTLGYITGWNRGSERLFGYAADEIIGHNILVLYADENEDDELFNAFLDQGSRELTVRRRRKSGEVFWASVSLSVVRDDDETPSGLIGYVVDITEKLAAEEKLRLHARIFECNSEAIIVTDRAQRILSVNKAFTRMTGFTEAEVRGGMPRMLAHAHAFGVDRHAILEAIELQGHWEGELSERRRDGDEFPAQVSISAVYNAQNELTNYFLVFSDITERKQTEEQIFRLAYYDPLTGLPNRSLLYSLLEQALAEAHRNHQHGALLFIDLNRFKHINDSFGHTPADTVLAEVGRRLSRVLRNEDVVSRLGGDEFVVALFDLTRREHAAHVASKVLRALAEPFYVERQEVLLSASIGISVFPDDGRDAETLIRNADVAMYRAKQIGTSNYLFYAREMNLRSLERLKLEGGLRRALERGEFRLHFQPQLDIRSQRIVGAEALLRWEHPENGMIPPALFIPVAEETGLINPIGEWVLDAACLQIRAWQEAGIDPVRIAINVSPRQFSQALPRAVLDRLERHAVPADYIELEITETMLMHSADSVVAMMRLFAEAGISMALDDFGTGYSSLSYLKRFPIDSLKIDQSFVRGIPHDANDSAISRAIISMAKALRLKVIAEGVETPEQLAFLTQEGCDEIQGYLFSPPLPADAFAALLRQTNAA